jgi:hypothetical protein
VVPKVPCCGTQTTLRDGFLCQSMFPRIPNHLCVHCFCSRLSTHKVLVLAQAAISACSLRPGRINNFAAAKTLSRTGLVRFDECWPEALRRAERAAWNGESGGRRSESIEPLTLCFSRWILDVRCLKNEAQRAAGALEAAWLDGGSMASQDVTSPRQHLFSSNIAFMLWKAGTDEVGVKRGGKPATYKQFLIRSEVIQAPGSAPFRL